MWGTGRLLGSYYCEAEPPGLFRLINFGHTHTHTHTLLRSSSDVYMVREPRARCLGVGFFRIFTQYFSHLTKELKTFYVSKTQKERLRRFDTLEFPGILHRSRHMVCVCAEQASNS